MSDIYNGSSDLENWLRSRNMTTKQFIDIIGCSRQTIWKCKKGSALSPDIAHRIMEVTNNQVSPKIETVGGRR